VQPAAVAPVTVYIVVTVGVTNERFAETPVPAGTHVYEEAPLADNVVESPRQIVGLNAVAVIVGLEFTTSNSVFVLVQRPLAPVIVYVVLTVGDTAIELDVDPPGFHV
jgi:hypothetical protein